MIVCEICKKPAVVHVTDVGRRGHDDRHYCREHFYENCAGVGREFSPFSFSSLSPQVVERLMHLLETVLVDSVGRVAPNPQRAVPAYIELLTDEEPCLRYWAAGWLGELGSDASAALGALCAATSDGNPHVRDAALHAIEKIEG